MSKKLVNGRSFVPYILKPELEQRISDMAAQIDRDFEGKTPLFIGILNGAFIFASELFKRLTIEAEISFIKLASYKGTKSTGQVVSAIGLDFDVNGRHVIILEDIIDTGKTLTHFLPQLQVQQPASISLCVLLHKPEAMLYPLSVEYVGFSIPNKFVLGYGLDFDGIGRNIPEIFVLEEEEMQD